MGQSFPKGGEGLQVLLGFARLERHLFQSMFEVEIGGRPADQFIQRAQAQWVLGKAHPPNPCTLACGVSPCS